MDMPSAKRTWMGVRATTSLALCALVALALSACGSSTTVTTDQSARAGTSTGATRTGGSTSTSPDVSTSTGTTSTATGAMPGQGTPACTAATLKLSYLGGQGATGHGLLGFALTNTSSHPCHTYGYPGVLFLDRAGAGLPTIPSRTTHDYFGSAPKVKLVVKPGKSVSFRLGVTHGNGGETGCTTAYGLQAIPPDDTHTLRVTIANGGAYECRTVTVSPLRPGRTAYP
jgi:hypothetical protein